MPDIGEEASERFINRGMQYGPNVIGKSPKFAKKILSGTWKVLKFLVRFNGAGALFLFKGPQAASKFLKKFNMIDNITFQSMTDAELNRIALLNLNIKPEEVIRTGNTLWISQTVKEKYFNPKDGKTKKFAMKLNQEIEKFRQNPEYIQQVEKEVNALYQLEKETVNELATFSEGNKRGQEYINQVNIKTQESSLNKDNVPQEKAERIAFNDMRLRKEFYQGFQIAYIDGMRPTDKQIDHAIANCYGTELGKHLNLDSEKCNSIEFCPNKNNDFDITYSNDKHALSAISNYKPMIAQEQPVIIDFKAVELDNNIDTHNHNSFALEKININDKMFPAAIDKDFYLKPNQVEMEALGNYMKENDLINKTDKIEFTNNDGKTDVAIFSQNNTQPTKVVRLEPQKMYTEEIRNIKSDVKEVAQEKKQTIQNKKEKSTIQRAKSASKAQSSSSKTRTKTIKAPDKGTR